MDKAEFERLAVEIVGPKGWQTHIAKKLGYTPRTIRRYLHIGRIPNRVAIAIKALRRESR